MKSRRTRGETQAEDLARKNAEFRVLQRVSSEINATLEVEEIYRISLATMGELFDFHHSVIFLLDEDAETLTVVASRGYEGQAVGGKVRMGVGVAGVVAKKRRALHMNNLGLQRSYLSAQRRSMVEAGRSDEIQASIPVPGLPDVECQIAIPLLVKDTLIGVFSVESSEPRTFTEHDESLVTIVANQTASAIHTARLNRALQKANDELEERVKLRTAELEHELAVAQEFLREAKRRVEGTLLGESPAVGALRAAIDVQAERDGMLLIEGPPGAGKEAAARAIHASSARHKGAFIHVRCPQLQTNERSSLFGATAALGDPVAGVVEAGGKFALARGGTLYLDGVEGLPRELQKDLLDVVSRLDTARNRGIQPEVRIILATSQDLSQEVQSSRFNLELYRLIRKERLSVPALCERPEDLPVLVEHIIREASRQFGRNVERISDASLARLQAYTWPGNIRELRGALERAVLVATGPVLEIEEDTLDGGISLGSYRLIEKIGSGGMGEVWLGRHALLARPAAVKLLRTEVVEGSSGRNLRERFQREAHVTANLRSPHTVQLFDFGVGETGTFYYIMELLYGLDISQMVRRLGPLPAGRTIMLLEQACRSLTEAHEQGLIHRDIKPANLFVTVLGPEYDFLKVLDFGMVKGILGEEAMQLTMEGTVQGTPAFMAPELALGEAEVDGRADLYSLGCVAYWMLTGTLVFHAKNAAQMLMQHLQSVPKAPSQVTEIAIPETLEKVVLRCLEKRPDARPGSAAELGEELRELGRHHPWTQEQARTWWLRHAPDALGGGR